MKKKHIQKKLLDKCDVCLFVKMSCICQPSWENFHELFKKPVKSSLSPSPLRISTITFGFKLENTEILLSELSRNFKKTLFARSIEFKKNSKKSKKSSLNYNFYNQCSIQCFIPHEIYKNQLVKISIKIFHNGSFNVTGARSIQGIVHTIRELLKYLLSYDNVLKYSGKIRIKDVKINMINTDFSIDKKIKQKMLNDILNDKKYSIENGSFIKRSIFDPDSYHGVKIKYVYNNNENLFYTRKGIEKLESELSILVFNTGNIIITGGKTAEETVGAYNFILNVLDEWKDFVIKDKKVIQKKKKRKIYLKSVEFKKLQDELNNEKNIDEKRQQFNLKNRILVQIQTQEHKSKFINVLRELLLK